MKCDKCGKDGAKYYELLGALWSYLCPRCRTDFHTFMASNGRVTEYWSKKVEVNRLINDPILFDAAHMDFLDIEWELHKLGKHWIYEEGHGDEV